MFFDSIKWIYPIVLSPVGGYCPRGKVVMSLEVPQGWG